MEFEKEVDVRLLFDSLPDSKGNPVCKVNSGLEPYSADGLIKAGTRVRTLKRTEVKRGQASVWYVFQVGTYGYLCMQDEVEEV
jgi:hypothetical protein